MKVLITPRGFANVGLNQVQRMKQAGLEVHYNACLLYTSMCIRDRSK